MGTLTNFRLGHFQQRCNKLPEGISIFGNYNGVAQTLRGFSIYQAGENQTAGAVIFGRFGGRAVCESIYCMFLMYVFVFLCMCCCFFNSAKVTFVLCFPNLHFSIAISFCVAGFLVFFSNFFHDLTILAFSSRSLLLQYAIQ